MLRNTPWPAGKDSSTDTSGVPQHYSSCQTASVALPTVQSASAFRVLKICFLYLSSNSLNYTKQLVRSKMNKKRIFWFRITFCLTFPTFRHNVSYLEGKLKSRDCIYGLFHTQLGHKKGLLLTQIIDMILWQDSCLWNKHLLGGGLFNKALVLRCHTSFFQHEGGVLILNREKFGNKTIYFIFICFNATIWKPIFKKIISFLAFPSHSKYSEIVCM